MDTFHMLDIIPLLPLPYPPNGKSSYYVPCPHCDKKKLRWEAVDFEDETITIEHKVVKMMKGPALEKDGTKNISSLRTLPLVEGIGDYLKSLKQRQELMAKLQLNDYQRNDYICVDGTGALQRPDFITQHYALVLEKNNVKHMRFHDLRHHAATYLHKMGLSFKEIQEWLGHFSIKTTMDTFSFVVGKAQPTSYPFP